MLLFCITMGYASVEKAPSYFGTKKEEIMKLDEIKNYDIFIKGLERKKENPYTEIKYWGEAFYVSLTQYLEEEPQGTLRVGKGGASLLLIVSNNKDWDDEFQYCEEILIKEVDSLKEINDFLTGV